MTRMAEIITKQPIKGSDPKIFALNPRDLVTAIYNNNRPPNTVSIFEVRDDGTMLPLADLSGRTVTTQQGAFTLPLQLPDPKSLIYVRDAFWKVVDRVHCFTGTPHVLLFVQRHTPDIPIKFTTGNERQSDPS
jgi:hypothetical protein